MQSKKKQSPRPVHLGTPTDEFRALRRRLQIDTPEQAQMELIWQNIIFLVTCSAHPGPATSARLHSFHEDWKIAREERNRRNMWLAARQIQVP